MIGKVGLTRSERSCYSGVRVNITADEIKAAIAMLYHSVCQGADLDPKLIEMIEPLYKAVRDLGADMLVPGGLGARQ